MTIAQLDTRLVRTIDLVDAANAFLAGARDAGLSVPARFGTETVARLLGLRTNHPAKADDLELRPSDPATRAETAYSVAKILSFGGWEQQYVEDAVSTFVLPTLTSWQKRVLNTAVRFVGFPYVWGGTSEKAEAPFGVKARGGFDCSGFVWRVFKLQAYTGGAALNATIKGRTTYQMSGEVPRSKRISFSKLAPGDVVFFGPKGPSSKPGTVGHTGIYLGSDWMIHSSGQGVAVVPMTGWYRQTLRLGAPAAGRSRPGLDRSTRPWPQVTLPGDCRGQAGIRQSAASCFALWGGGRCFSGVLGSWLSQPSSH